jgi:amidase
VGSETDGKIPISASQDSPGPMARTVADAAWLLEIMMNTTGFITAARNSGTIRIGVVRSWMTKDEKTNALFKTSLSVLDKAGITLVDIDLNEPDDTVGEDEV